VPREPHRGNSNMMRSLLFPPCTSYKHSMYHYAFGSICNSRSFSFISFAMHMSFNVVALYPDCRTYLLTWLFYEMCLNRCGYYNMLGFRSKYNLSISLVWRICRSVRRVWRCQRSNQNMFDKRYMDILYWAVVVVFIFELYLQLPMQSMSTYHH
jgi:hypothetical protein